MYTFISVQKGVSPFIDSSVLPRIKILLSKYKNVLSDDYSSECFDDFLKEVVPHLYVGLKDREFVGFVYLSDWRGNRDKLHSCTMTVCIEKKFWGKTAREISRAFIGRIFKSYGLYKLKAEVFEHNKNVGNFLLSLGFKKEALLEGETFKNGKLINLVIYSVFNRNYI